MNGEDNLSQARSVHNLPPKGNGHVYSGKETGTAGGAHCHGVHNIGTSGGAGRQIK